MRMRPRTDGRCPKIVMVIISSRSFSIFSYPIQSFISEKSELETRIKINQWYPKRQPVSLVSALERRFTLCSEHVRESPRHARPRQGAALCSAGLRCPAVRGRPCRYRFDTCARLCSDVHGVLMSNMLVGSSWDSRIFSLRNSSAVLCARLLGASPCGSPCCVSRGLPDG